MSLQPALFANPSTRSEPMPNWLLRQLDADGVIDLAAGAVRRARPARCAKCRAWIVRGLDADWAALAADCDPGPLDAAGEALALIAGRASYSLRSSGGRLELFRRDRFSIAGHPAGSEDGVDVLAGHDCGRPLALTYAPSRIPKPPGSAGLPEDPPF